MKRFFSIHVCLTALLVFWQPGSASADCYQYDSTNAVNWQIRGKPSVQLKSKFSVSSCLPI